MGTNKPPLWKQLLGAVVGGLLGLALYTGYGYVQPVVKGWITLPGETHQAAQEEVTEPTAQEREQARLAARARAITEQRQREEQAAVAPLPESVNEEKAAREELIAKEPIYAEPRNEEAEPAYEEHAGAPVLPSSGLGWMAIATVLGGALWGFKKRSLLWESLAKGYEGIA